MEIENQCPEEKYNKKKEARECGITFLHEISESQKKLVINCGVKTSASSGKVLEELKSGCIFVSYGF